METKQGVCCKQCEDSSHTCTAWDGTGAARINLREGCPSDTQKCIYRLTNTPSNHFIKKSSGEKD
jgi:hypothetical protein